MKKVFIVLIFSFSFICQSLAQTQIKSEVDKIKISTDEALTYKLTIASSEKKITQPKFPEFKDFVVLWQAESSTISFIKGGAKTILVYTFLLTPKNTGKFTIEPTQVKTEGKTYASEEFEIEVTLGELSPKALPEEKPLKPKKAMPKSEEPQITL